MCPACATIALTIAGVSYAVNKLRKQNAADAGKAEDAETAATSAAS